MADYRQPDQPTEALRSRMKSGNPDSVGSQSGDWRRDGRGGTSRPKPTRWRELAVSTAMNLLGDRGQIGRMALIIYGYAWRWFQTCGGPWFGGDRSTFWEISRLQQVGEIACVGGRMGLANMRFAKAHRESQNLAAPPVRRNYRSYRFAWA